MADDTEKAELELQAASHYGTKPNANGEKVDNAFSETRESTSSTEESDDLIDEDELKQIWWLKLFPFLVKWDWFRRKFCYKKKETSELSYSFFSIVVPSLLLFPL